MFSGLKFAIIPTKIEQAQMDNAKDYILKQGST